MRLLLFVSLIFGLPSIKAQIIGVDVAGNYLYSGQWDRAIQTLNFNRTAFGTQPLLRYGFSVGTQYRIKREASPFGFSLRYGMVSSVNNFPGRRTVLQLHQLAIHGQYTMKPIEGRSLYLCFSGGLLSTLLLKKIESQYYVYDDQLARAVGIGPELSARLYYTCLEKSKLKFSPFLALSFSPFLWSPKTEALINQTSGLTSNAYTLLTQVNGGFIIPFN